MALNLPQLDDRSFESLLKDVYDALPRLNSDWTSRNPSDPGVMILELFAYLTEMNLFQLNQVSFATYEKFLNLLGVEIDQNEVLNKDNISAGIVQALSKLNYNRAISHEDIETIVIETLTEVGVTSRVYTFPSRDFSRFEYDKTKAMDIKEGHLLILITTDNTSLRKKDSATCLNETGSDFSLSRYTLTRSNWALVKANLFQRRILTSKMHIHKAEFQLMFFTMTIIAQKGSDMALLKERIKNNIMSFFCPVWGAEEGTGYNPGRAIKIPEVIEVVEDTEGVDFTTKFSAEYEIEIENGNIEVKLIQNSYQPKYYEIIRPDPGRINIEVLPASEE